MTVAEDGVILLTRCREDSNAWTEAACGEAIDNEGKWTDPNATRRYALLLALQYDLRPEDCALARYLFEQETLRHRREPFQGLYPALRLAGYLLSTYRIVENVWAFAEAKLANFDTYAGFDREHLVSAGIETTLSYVRQTNDHPQREEVLEWLTHEDGQCIYSEDDLEAWRRHTAEYYPAHQADENPLSWLSQSLELGDLAEARRWLEAWEATLPRTSRNLHSLMWYWTEIPDWDRACAAAAELLAHDDLDAWNRARIQTQAAGYHRQAGRVGEAARQFILARETLVGIESWWRFGLGRSALEEALRIAQAAPPNDAQGRELYNWAIAQLAHAKVSTLLLLKLAEATAAHVGDEQARARYHELAVQERQRIDQKPAALPQITPDAPLEPPEE